MVSTRSSPRKRPIDATQPDVERDLEDEPAHEDVTIDIDEAEVRGKKLAPADNNPPKLFVLPKDASGDARIVTLPEPASGAPGRYFACPQKGMFEFTRVAAPKSQPRSFLLAPADQVEEEQKISPSSGIARGYVAESAAIFIATPVDPTFFLVPLLAPAATKNQKRLFVTFDDHIESATPGMRQLLRQESYRRMFEARLDNICDKVEAGDESMYRLSTERLAAVLVSKAKRMVQHGLPPSMEEQFVRQALQAPLLSIKREDTFITQTSTTEDTQPGASETQDSQTVSETSAAETDSQSTPNTQLSTTTSMTSISINPDADILSDAPPAAHEASEQVRHLLRLRTSLTYLSACYIPPHVSSTLTYSLLDFTPLDTHLKYLSSLHEEARALRALSDNITRKRGLDDDEAAEERAEKKRKKEEDEKRKKQESNAMKALKKVDTSGMKKLSSFFTKVPNKR